MSRKDKIEIIGRQFGHWTVLEESYKKGNRTFYKCKCGLCQNIYEVDGSILRRGQTTHCKNCTRKDREMIGKTYGSWEVVSYSHTSNKKPYYNCKCACGTEEKVQGCNLRLGKTIKCKKCSGVETAVRNSGKKLSKETKDKISKAHIGKPLSEEHKKKLRIDRDDLCDENLLQLDSQRMERRSGLKISYYINQKRHCAHSRGKTWNLTNIEAAQLIIQPCNYCGSLPNPYNGIDRVDNSIGYELGNVVPCCKYCNSAKSTKTLEEFKDHILKIYTHFIKNQK